MPYEGLKYAEPTLDSFYMFTATLNMDVCVKSILYTLTFFTKNTMTFSFYVTKLTSRIYSFETYGYKHRLNRKQITSDTTTIDNR